MAIDVLYSSAEVSTELQPWSVHLPATRTFPFGRSVAEWSRLAPAIPPVAVQVPAVELNVAATVVAVLMVTIHVPVPVQAPDQPEKVEPASAVAVRVTEAPLVNEAEQVAPQLIPARLDITVPVSVPTYGGVTASFAMQADIIIAEPKALIGFAGPRVIEETIKEQLPDGFQRSEFLLNHGMIDMIVERKRLKEILARVIPLMMDNIMAKTPDRSSDPLWPE